jgi:L-ascorbate metabolism protein UlaG (beta-lactamase superfamily)
MTTKATNTITRKAALLNLAAITGAAGILADATPAAADGTSGGRTSVRYFGTAAWEISDGTTVIWIDPYVSRIIGPPPPGTPPYRSAAGDARLVYGWDDVVTPDARAISARVPRADYILVTHTHYDHIFDVPQIALNTGATVIGTESSENVLRAYGVPEKQLITVRGGEDFDFPTFSVKVIPSIHSALDHKHYFSSAVAPTGLKGPLTLRQIHPEGGTLAFLVRIRGHQILAFGSMNYIERELDGLEPDILIAGAGASRHEIYEYTNRLMHCVGRPPIVLPTHWDNFLAPYGASQQPSIDALQSFVAEVRAASPSSKVIIPAYFSSLTV